jgi:nucleotide-binding universal stress UspA family protein
LVLNRSLQDDEFSTQGIGRILNGCGRPLLLLPSRAPGDPPSIVAIAWKETAEAARAVTAAMPLLQKASRIVVLTASEDQKAADCEASAQRLADQLRWHGFKAEAHHVPPNRRSGAESVMAVASDMGAELIVMGAYSHSRPYEFVFGGFTRYALKHATLPVLMAH